MKKIFFVFTLLASIATTNSFASDGIIAPEVLKSFQNKFATAKEVDWAMTNDLYRVRFQLNGQCITAFYKTDGALAAITRHISPLQLPVALHSTLKNEYKGHWVADLFELSNDEGVQYYVTMEDADTTVVLKSSAALWTVYQKQRK
jgi:hypothetical protein